MVGRWSVVDFILILVGGIVGAVLLGSAAGSAADDSTVTLLQLGGQFLGYLVTFLLIRQRKGNPEVGFAAHGRDVLYALAGFALQIVFALVLNPLAKILLPDGNPQMLSDMISGSDSMAFLVPLVLITVLAAPIIEELMFRGVLMRALDARGERFALIVSSLVFSARHLLGLDANQFWASALLVLPPLFVLGLILGRVTQRTGRLGPAIFIHSGWNLLAALVLLLPGG